MSAHPILSDTPARLEDRALSTESLCEANMDLVARILRGSFVYPMLLGIVAALTRYKADHASYFWMFAVAIAVTLSGRLIFWIWRRRIYKASPALFDGFLVTLIAIPSGAAGLLTLSALLFYDFESRTFVTVLMWIAGIAASSTISFTPSFRLLQLHLLLLLGPVCLLEVLRGGVAGHSLAVATATMMVFLLLQGRYLHSVFWKHIRDAAREKVRIEELENAKKAAEAASIAKGEFLASMSHEIRTPMHGVLGMAQLAIDAKDPQEAQEYLKTLRCSAEGLLHLLNGILDFSKIEAGKFALDQSRLLLRELIEEIGKTMSPLAGAKRLDLTCGVETQVPDQLVGDSARLRQVLVNLLGNAIKFTEYGSVRLEVTGTPSRLKENEIQLQFRVSDTGIGISQDQQSQIFEAFTQANPSIGRRFGGTGLGLAVCSRLVRLMGGRITVESNAGCGSVFQFTCILGIADEPGPVPQKEILPIPLEPLAILLAEDNPVNQTIALKMLTLRGHHVTVVADGTGAIDAWRSSEFDLILMDIQMPEPDGMEAARRIRALEAVSQRRRTVIIALTASAMEGDRQRFLDAGMDGYLTKPFNAKALYEILSSFDHHPVNA